VETPPTRTIVFVCQHGAARSRIAAAWFDAKAPAGWKAFSAGIEPDPVLSPTAARLLAGSAAESFLDPSPPRPMHAIADALRVIGIDCHLESATEVWDLEEQESTPELSAEIRERVESLLDELGGKAG
jgi:protein-tyrosine-phosphatase